MIIAHFIVMVMIVCLFIISIYFLNRYDKHRTRLKIHTINGEIQIKPTREDILYSDSLLIVAATGDNPHRFEMGTEVIYDPTGPLLSDNRFLVFDVFNPTHEDYVRLEDVVIFN